MLRGLDQAGGNVVVVDNLTVSGLFILILIVHVHLQYEYTRISGKHQSNVFGKIAYIVGMNSNFNP